MEAALRLLLFPIDLLAKCLTSFCTWPMSQGAIPKLRAKILVFVYFAMSLYNTSMFYTQGILVNVPCYVPTDWVCTKTVC